MSTVISNKITRFQMMNIMFGILLMYVMGLLIIKDNEAYQTEVENELRYVKQTLSKQEWAKLYDETLDRYEKLLQESGALDTIKELFLPIESSSEVNKAFSGEWNFRAVNNFQILVYQLLHRVTLMQYTLMLFLPLMLAIIFTGYNKWRINRFALGGQSTRAVRIWLKMVWITTSMFIAYIVVPVPIVELSLIIPPALLVLFAMAISQIIQSFDK